MKLVFYNHYGMGDLFESREFVKDWMRLAGVTTAVYAHRSCPGMFPDLPCLDHADVRAEMDMRKAVTRVEGREASEGPELWVNTWIGRDSGYVVNPGIGCVVEQLYRMHSDMLREAAPFFPRRSPLASRLSAGLPPLPRTIAEYIPSIDYSRVPLGNLHTWLYGRRGQRLVLLCNGTTGSGQASNFDFGPLLDALPVRDDVTYVCTNPVEYSARPDVYFMDHIGPKRQHPDDSDLPAISYLSRHCTAIVGRCHGTHDHGMVLENWMDSTKTLVCFTHHRNGACFVLNPEALGLRMKVVWSPADNGNDAATVLRGVLGI